MDSNMENEMNYARSGQIMLTSTIILFIIIIIMLSLHILIRWCLQPPPNRHRLRRNNRHVRSQPFIFYTASDSLTFAFSRGLDASVISSLPLFKFSDKNNQPLDCAVCLSEFEEGETGRVLPKCNHSFHIDCIDMWFHSHSTCPLCRAPVEAPSVQLTRSEDVTIDVPEPESVFGSGSGEELNRSEPEPIVSSSLCSNEKQSSLVGVSNCDCESVAVEESSGDSTASFLSPMNRVLSLKRILSRERKSSVSGSSDCVAVNGSAVEVAAESGGMERTQ